MGLVQINLNLYESAQDLLSQTIYEKRIEAAIISKHYRNKGSVFFSSRKLKCIYAQSAGLLRQTRLKHPLERLWFWLRTVWHVISGESYSVYHKSKTLWIQEISATLASLLSILLLRLPWGWRATRLHRSSLFSMASIMVSEDTMRPSIERWWRWRVHLLQKKNVWQSGESDFPIVRW